MKKLYSIALLLISLSGMAQTPQAINYQGVARQPNGTPITGSIAVRIEIHRGNPTNSIVCTEIFNVTASQFGLFDLKIGSNNPTQFAAINWGSDLFFARVFIDPSNGTNFGTHITHQQLMSVPYALYAEKSGGVGPTTTITSSNPSIINVVSAPPSHTVNYTPPQLLLTQDSVLRITQGTYTSSAVIIKGTQPAATSTATPLGPWSSASNNVFLAVGSNNVGIGTSTPAAKLEVNANPLSTNNAIAAYAQGGNGVLALTSSTSNLNAAVIGSNSGNGSGIVGTTGALNGISAGVQGNHNGNGPGVYGSNTTSATVGTAHGVVEETNSGNPATAGVIGINNGQGPGVYGYQNLPSGGPGVWGVSNSSTEPGIKGVAYGGSSGVFGDVGNASSSPGANGVFGRTNSSSGGASGVVGQNMGAGHGVMGTTSSGNSTACAVYGRNSGGGIGVYGEASSNINIVPAVHGNQIGSGPALRGSMPTSSAAGMPNVALLVENGHIQATSATPLTLTSANNTGTNVGTAAIVANSNDVRGMVTLNVTSAANWNPGGTYDFTVHFHKAYMSPGPWVTISKYDQSNFICEISAITTTNFTVRIKNANPGQTPPGVTQLRFTYMVMQ